MPSIALHHSIEEIGRSAWDACFPNSLERYDYLHATEHAGIQNFQWRYLVAREGETVVAAIPAFLTRYHLDTTLDAGGLRDYLQRIKQHVPWFLSLKLACLGSPVTEYGEIGWHPNAKDKPGTLATMLAFFENITHAQGYHLQAIKDFPPQLEPAWKHALQRYTIVNGLPVAHLPIDFTDMDAYFAKLSHATRKDMRRKLKRREEVRTEIVSDIPPEILPRIMALYHDTHTRAEMKFEELTPEFFNGMMQSENALCVLYWHGETLLAFNLLLRDDTTLLDKYFCMDLVQGREFNLYFLSWFINIEYCLSAGITRFQSGAANYDIKLRLGSRLEPTAMAYRHTNPILNALLRIAAPLLAPDNPLEGAHG